MPVSSLYESTELPPWLNDLYKSMGERSEALRKEEYKPYDKERLEPFNEDINKSFELARETGGWKPYLEQGKELIGKGTKAYPEEWAGQYQNPYQQAVINSLTENANQNFTENVLPALEAHFVGLGQHGSTRHQEMVARAQREHEKTLQNQIAQSLYQGYGQGAQIFNYDQARALEAARLAPEYAVTQKGGQLADISTLGATGAQQQARAQGLKDIAYEDFLRQQRHPYETLKEQAGIVHGTPYGSSTYQAQQTPGAGQVNTAGQLGALSSNLLGAALAYGGGGGGRKKGGRIKRRFADGGSFYDQLPSMQDIYNKLPSRSDVYNYATSPEFLIQNGLPIAGGGIAGALLGPEAAPYGAALGGGLGGYLTSKDHPIRDTVIGAGMAYGGEKLGQYLWNKLPNFRGRPSGGSANELRPIFSGERVTYSHPSMPPRPPTGGSGGGTGTGGGGGGGGSGLLPMKLPDAPTTPIDMNLLSLPDAPYGSILPYMPDAPTGPIGASPARVRIPIGAKAGGRAGGGMVPGLNRAVNIHDAGPNMPIYHAPMQMKKGGVGGHPFTQSSFTRKPKVGGKHKIQGMYK